MVKTGVLFDTNRTLQKTNLDTGCSLLLNRCSVTAHNTFCPPCVKGPNNGYEGDFPLAFENMKKHLSVFYYRTQNLQSSFSISSHDAFENADLRRVLNACHVAQSPWRLFVVQW